MGLCRGQEGEEIEKQTQKVYTGRHGLCMIEKCDWWGLFQGSAQAHSEQKQHFVRERWMQKFPESKENIRGLKEALNGGKRY
jgi:hypothetical protein